MSYNSNLNMNSTSPLGYAVAFYLIYALYWLAIKLHVLILLAQILFDRLIRSLRLSPNSIMKIHEKIQSLNKLPAQVIVAVELNEEINHTKIAKTIVENVLYNVQVIRSANISNITLFFWGSNAENLQMLQNLIEEQEYRESLGNINIVCFDKFHQSLSNESIRWNKKSVPLLISMSSYNSINCLPFGYLIDTQFVFCPPITECSPIDIQRCFQQYANSKQRHGK